MELKQQVGILTCTVNSLMDETTPTNVTSNYLPSKMKLPAKTFKEMDKLEELLQVPSTQQAMVSFFFVFDVLRHSKNG